MNLLEAADAYCRFLAQGHYENFKVASKIVRGRVRDDLMRFYAFCRTTDDLGDESGAPAQALARLERWRRETEAFFEGAPPVHPVLIALQETVAHYRLDRQPFLDLIAANEQDQRICVYHTWPELQEYCLLSAAPVGRVVLRFFAIAGQRAQQLSDDVCIGLQLANHAQDVSRDEKIGRRYLLQEDIDAYGVEGAVRELVTRARTLLGSGKDLEKLAPAPLRVQLALYRLGGLAICDAIEQTGFRTQVTRPHVSNGAKMRILLRALLEAPHRA
jgi:squalene synthase HpnC